jgi:hypothetical protein
MKSASKTSSGRPAGKAPDARTPKYPFTTSNARGRKREARRWLDVLGARCTNGARNPNPLTVYESGRLHTQALDDLEARDKTLYDAVQQCIWDEMVKTQGITMKAWRRRALRNARRMNEIRATFR